MRKNLLSANKGYFKANLHCHSTISDGKKTPKELKEMYMEQGYSVIAYTDHDVMLDHGDLCDENFLALNGYEMEISEENDKIPVKTCHLCFVALEPNNVEQVCYHREKYLFGNAPKYRKYIKFDASKPDFERVYNAACINEMIAEGRKNGFFVTYNHPTWSLETLNEYGKYNGMHAMEICNYSSLVEGYPEYNEHAYEDMLRSGKKIFCISADDNHNYNAAQDSFGAFTVINAEKLEYKTITDALVRGDFYASMGPEITELWYEEHKIGIRCSSAAKIVLNAGNRRAEAVYADAGSELTSAVFSVDEKDIYVRVTVTDASGKHANTRAYFIEDLLQE